MKILYLFVLVFMTACTVRNDDKFYMPAEWEPHDAIWLGWEDDQLQYRPAVINIIKSLKPHVRIKVAVSGDSLMRVAKRYLQQGGIDSSELQFYNMSGDRYWIRDHGASFLVNGKGQLARDQDGHPFKVVKVPLPDLIVKKITAKAHYDSKADEPSPFLKPSYFVAKEAYGRRYVI